MSIDEAVADSGAQAQPRPGLAHGWTRGPTAEDASVFAHTDVRSGRHRTGYLIHLLAIGDDSRSATAPVTRDSANALPELCLGRVDGTDNLAEYGVSLCAGDYILMGLVIPEVGDIDELIDRATTIPALHGMQRVVVTDAVEHRNLIRYMQSGALSSVLKSLWASLLLAGQVYSTMVHYLQGCGYSDRQIRSLIADPPPFAVQNPSLEGLDRDEREVVMELLADVERMLGQKPRLIVPEGTQLVAQGEPMGAVYPILDDQVSLHRNSPQGEVLVHPTSSEPLIGLVLPARTEDALFMDETATEVILVRLTIEQLQIVIPEDPSISVTLTALAIYSLTRRPIRTGDLHLGNAMLAEDLETRKETLTATFEDLRAIRAELVERTRFAMLDELNADIAHELNNPITVLVCTVRHLYEDVDAVLAAPATTSSGEAMARTLTTPSCSTSVGRALMRELLPVVDDRVLVRCLIRVGIQGAKGTHALAQTPGGIGAYGTGVRLDGPLRSVFATGDRVIELIQSLRGYARPDAEDLKSVSVREGIDDVLRLTARRVQGIRIDCDCEDVPAVRAYPAKLQQVWTNLTISAARVIEDETADPVAAAEASGDASGLPTRDEAEAIIRITVRPTPEGVSIDIQNNDPGTDPGIIDKIMELYFTAGAGRVRLGLGMGMSVVRSIIADHGDTLTVGPYPGSTIMRISLPA